MSRRLAERIYERGRAGLARQACVAGIRSDSILAKRSPRCRRAAERSSVDYRLWWVRSSAL